MHGGASTGAPVENKNAYKHGIYGRLLQKDELAIGSHIDLESIDDEIRLTKLQLRRVLIALNLSDENPNNLSLLEMHQVHQGTRRLKAKLDGDRATTSYKAVTWQRPNYRELFIRLTGRIAKLVSQRAGLLRMSPETIVACLQPRQRRKYNGKPRTNLLPAWVINLSSDDPDKKLFETAFESFEKLPAGAQADLAAADQLPTFDSVVHSVKADSAVGQLVPPKSRPRNSSAQSRSTSRLHRSSERFPHR
jgi:hypothetical protein